MAIRDAVCQRRIKLPRKSEPVQREVTEPALASVQAGGILGS